MLYHNFHEYRSRFSSSVQAERNGLITIRISADNLTDVDGQLETAPGLTMFDDIWEKEFYQSVSSVSCASSDADRIRYVTASILQTDQSTKALKWNLRRRAALQHCVEKLLYPMFANEVRQKLIAEARTAALETVQQAVRKKMYRLLAHKGWRPPRADDGDEAAADDEELFSDSMRHHGASPPIGPRTLAITYSSEQYVFVRIIAHRRSLHYDHDTLRFSTNTELELSETLKKLSYNYAFI